MAGDIEVGPIEAGPLEAGWRAGWMGSALAALTWLAGCSSPEEGPPIMVPSGWAPGTMLAGEREGVRGHLDLRGLIHAHSVYSHDACDGEPRDGAGNLNEGCFDDFRRDLCRAAHDFVMLTDHNDSFSESEFPDVLLHRPDLGDALVIRAGEPVASWAACAENAPSDGPPAILITAGTESATMAVGLDGHVAEIVAERKSIYGEASATAIAAMQAEGALVLAQHTEDWSADQIIDLGFDGFEMYNLHANTITGAGGAIALIKALQEPETLPASDLFLLPIINEDDRYLSRWGSVLSRDHRAVTTIGTDCHQNTFPQLLPDGERVDSYRRMMAWMSNHLLVEPEADGRWDDSHLEEALAAGRLYGVFEVFGYPTGFDFRALEGGAVREMGATVSLAEGVVLEASLPAVREASPELPAPIVALRLLRAVEGGWELVAETEGDLSVAVDEPGAYRVEARITPKHLEHYLASFTDLAHHDFPWIYANAIYVAP